METLKRLFSIHGRMNRWKSFVWMVACSVLSGVISTIIELLFLPLPFSFPLNAPSMTAYVVLSGIVAVIGLIFSLTVVVRKAPRSGVFGMVGCRSLYHYSFAYPCAAGDRCDSKHGDASCILFDFIIQARDDRAQ